LPFKLVIRHNIEQTADDFECADVRHFLSGPVTIGAASDCDCVLPDTEGLSERHFTIELANAAEAEAGWLVRREAEAALFLNHDPVVEPSMPLVSGDEIRVGHYTFRFQTEHKTVGLARRTDLLAAFTKTLIVVILVAEVSLVYWLPKKLQSETVLAEQIRQQETVLLLDQLRRQTRQLASASPGGSIEAKACAVLQEELDQMASFLRQHERELDSDQWFLFHSDVRDLRAAFAGIRSGEVFRPLPKLAFEAGVSAITRKQEEKK
jgi:hypothetical protein